MLLVTGATGFVGQALCERLSGAGLPVLRALRTAAPGATNAVAIGNIDAGTDWSQALQDVDCVVHLAARAHVMRDAAADPLAAYRSVNVAGTARLAREAAAHGVRRLVFLSSIKVNGERTHDHAYTEGDAPQPEDAYGISKWEAEQALRAAAGASGLEVVVLRAPLVYGPGVKGNFLRLLRFVHRGWPLPLASVRNRRSLVYLGNLVDAIAACTASPAATGRTYLVSDGEDLSTPDLVRGIARALAVEARLFPFPASLLRAGAALLGRAGEAARLIGSLQLDSTRLRSDLGWRPPYTVRAGLEETARWYLRLQN